jgi:hypothetical protein
LIPSPEKKDSALALARRNSREGRIFALTLTGGFLFVALLANRKNAHGVAVAAFSLFAVSLLAALFVPRRLGPVRRAWRTAAASGAYGAAVLVGARQCYR